MVALCLVACSKTERPATAVNLNSRLIARWTADTNGQDSAGGFHGALTGGVAVVSNEGGKAFSFDGTKGSVLVLDSPKLNFGANKDFSITARIQPLRTNTAFGVMSIVDKRQVVGISAAVGYSLHLEDGRLACQIAPAARWQWKPADFMSLPRIKASWQRRKQIVPMKFARFISAGPDLRDGLFHEVALTVARKSPEGGKLFVDGRLVLTFDPTKQPESLANTAPLLIGGHPDATLNCGFKGQIGDVRLYSRALSAAEVEALCQAETATDAKH